MAAGRQGGRPCERTSIGTWAYNVGPYGENPIPFPTVLEQLPS